MFEIAGYLVQGSYCERGLALLASYLEGTATWVAFRRIPAIFKLENFLINFAKLAGEEGKHACRLIDCMRHLVAFRRVRRILIKNRKKPLNG